MNYIGKVAEMLGVEIGEEFKIEFEGGMLSDDSCMLLNGGNVSFWWIFGVSTLYLEFNKGRI